MSGVQTVPAHGESQVLTLTGQTAAAYGHQCTVYFHPSDPALLIKIPRHPSESADPWYKTLIRGRYNAARRELAECRALAANAPHDLDLIERSDGFVETDLGLGLAVEALCDRSGHLAPNLLHAPHLVPERRAIFQTFLTRIIASPLLAHDLKVRNIVLAHDPVRGIDRFVLVDGIGRRPDLPYEGLSRWLDRFNKRRRARKLMAEIEALTAAA